MLYKTFLHESQVNLAGGQTRVPEVNSIFFWQVILNYLTIWKQKIASLTCDLSKAEMHEDLVISQCSLLFHQGCCTYTFSKYGWGDRAKCILH